MLLSSCIRLRKPLVAPPLFGRFLSQNSSFEGLLKRTADRLHRALYRRLERQETHYGLLGAVLRPSIALLLVQLRLESEKAPLNVSYLVNQHTTRNNHTMLLETAVFHVLRALNNEGDSLGSSEEPILALLLKLYSYARPSVIQNDPKRNRSQESESPPSFDQIRLFTEESTGLNVSDETALLRTAFGPNLNAEALGLLEKTVMAFLLVSKTAFLLSYATEKDLIPWIRSISASSVTSSCAALTNATNIPAFVSSDILLRTPMTHQEFSLQTDLWHTFGVEISLEYAKNNRHLKDCIDNLVFYATQYSPTQLPGLLKWTLDVSSTNKTLQKVFLQPQYLSRLVWKVVYDLFRRPETYGKRHALSIVRAQETVVEYLAKTGDPSLSTRSKLALDGQMGVILAVNMISPEKARKLLAVIEPRVSEGSRKHLSMYYVTKISVSTSPEQLLHSFHGTMDRSPAVWLAFVKKLHELGLLNEERAIKILRELEREKKVLIITKDVVSALLVPVTTLQGFEKFMSILQGGEKSPSTLAVALSSTVIAKYLSVLYREATSEKEHISAAYCRTLGLVVPEAGFFSRLEYARYIYENVLRKTPNLVGIRLHGEGRFQPENIFQMYNSELGSMSPSHRCISALMSTAIRSPNTMWGDMYAAQVAIHEFKQYVAANQTSGGSYDADKLPDDSLWQKFIELLARYEYVAEMAPVIEWWERIHFRPSHATLLLLLRAMPAEYSERYVQHAEKVQNESVGGEKGGLKGGVFDWPWPSAAELRLYR